MEVLESIYGLMAVRDLNKHFITSVIYMYSTKDSSVKSQVNQRQHTLFFLFFSFFSLNNLETAYSITETNGYILLKKKETNGYIAYSGTTSFSTKSSSVSFLGLNNIDHMKRQKDSNI